MRACSFCGAASEQVTKLIAGPPPYGVCDRCVDLLSEIVEVSEPNGATSPGRCAFCGGAERKLILPSVAVSGHPDAAMCHDCVGLCVRVMAEG